MAKIKIFPREAIKINTGSGYKDFSKVCSSDGSYDIGDSTNIDVMAAYSQYCTNGSICTYDIFNDNMSATQIDSIHREYTVTYVDDNGCESSNKFCMSSDIFTRPVDEVTSDHPKGITKMTTEVSYKNWWKNDNSSGSTYWWDPDSAFATLVGNSCQGICNGFELSPSVFIEFYSGETSISDAGKKGRNIPWDDINWTLVPNIDDWWCHPIELETNQQKLDREQGAVDILGGKKGCWGLSYTDNPGWILADRRSNITYGANEYDGASTYRLGKLVIELPETMDAFASLGGISGSRGIESISACSYDVTWHDNNTFTAALNGDVPAGYNFAPTVSGKTIHFMKKCEVYLYQKSTNPAPVTETYTYTVYSNVDGATVEWDGASPVSNRRGAGTTNTIDPECNCARGTNTTGGEVSVTISKPGVTFSNGGVGTIYKTGGSTRVNEASTPMETACDVFEVYSPDTKYNYKVYSNVDGATVEFWDGSYLLSTCLMSSGVCSASTTSKSITVKISKDDCVFSPSSKVLTEGGEVTMNGECGSPSTTCLDGSVSGLGDKGCVSNEPTTNKVWIGNWTKSPSGCDETWAYDTSRNVSGTAFIETGTIEFRNDGTIYGKVATKNESSVQRTCYIPAKLGSVKSDYFIVYQCASIAPVTCNTCADIGLYEISGFTFADKAAGQLVATFKSSCNPPAGFRASHKDGSSILSSISVTNISGNKYGIFANIDSNSSADRTETLNIILVNNEGLNIICESVVVTQLSSCAGAACPDPSTSFIQHSVGTVKGYSAYFDSNCWDIIGVAASDGNLVNPSISGKTVGITCKAGAVGNTAYVTVLLRRGYDNTTQRKTINISWVCTNASPCPDPVPNTISHEVGTIDTYDITINAPCWKIISLDETSPNIMTSSYAGNIVHVTCSKGEIGDSASVIVNLQNKTTYTTTAKTITASWVCSGEPSRFTPTTISHTHTKATTYTVAMQDDCWEIYDTEIVSKIPPTINFVSDSYVNGSGGWHAVNIRCNATASAGYSATIRIHLRMIGNTSTTRTQDIPVTWV